ncbi:MAG: hypothetical protein ABI846_09105 [Rudaea sp.]
MQSLLYGIARHDAHANLRYGGLDARPLHIDRRKIAPKDIGSPDAPSVEHAKSPLALHERDTLEAATMRVCGIPSI